METDRGRREPGRARRQVVHAAPGAAGYGLGIEQHQVGRMTFAQQPAIFQAEEAGRLARQAMHSLRQAHHAQIAAPVAAESAPPLVIAIPRVGVRVEGLDVAGAAKLLALLR